MLKELLIFCAGAASGGAAVYFSVKSFFKEKLAKEEAMLNSVYEQNMEELKKAATVLVSDPEPKADPAEPPDVESLNNILTALRYSQHQAIEREAAKAIADDYPNTCPPSEFGNDPSFGTMNLILFTDGVLTDEKFMRIDDVSSVGDYNLDRFDEYEVSDMIYVKNCANRMYYAIKRDYRDFEEAVSGR